MIQAILFGCVFSFWMVDVVVWERWKPLNRKPFNCLPCLSAWSALVAYFIPMEILNPALILFAGGCAGILFEKLMKQ